MNSQATISPVKDKISQRYEANMQFFKQHLPYIHKQIISNKEPSSLTLDANTLRLNKVINGKTIYPEGAVEAAQKEVSNFINRMNRIEYRPRPTDINIGFLIKDKPFLRTINKYAHNISKSKKRLPSHADLAIFGCGLGYHIEMLCNKEIFHHITIIENDIRNFKESLYTINWASIMMSMKDKRQMTLIINDDDRGQLDYYNHIKVHLHKLFPSSVVSMLVYNHIGSNDDYSDVKRIINEHSFYTKVIYERLGPDTQRLMNANENCRLKRKILNLDDSTINAKDTKIAIIGAGPSIDDYRSILKKNRDKFIIISAGSSLGSLLKHGITPDYHVELEFLNVATSLLEYVNNDYPLKDITLIHSLEGNPGYASLFKDSYMFSQETTELINHIESKHVLKRGGLTCTNGASAIACRLSNADIYFFGVDYAYTRKQHHESDNITNKRNLPIELTDLEEAGKSLESVNLSISTMDVHGNKVGTTPSLNSARLLMESLIAESGNNFYNCSNGAKINGSNHLNINQLDEILSSSKEININKKAKLTFDHLDYYHIHQSTIELLEVSFTVVDQIIPIVESAIDIENKEACKLIDKIIKGIEFETKDRQGQFRSIMSLNRMPLLLLYLLINYSSEEDSSEIIKYWLMDYKSYYKFVKEKIMKVLKGENHYLKEEWLE